MLHKTHNNEFNLACGKLSFIPTTIQLSGGKKTNVISEEYNCLLPETTETVWAKYRA
jgi:hypothetical protein